MVLFREFTINIPNAINLVGLFKVNVFIKNEIKNFLKFSWIDILILVSTILGAQLFFVLRVRYVSVLLFLFLAFLFKFLKKVESAQFCSFIGVFFLSFWFMEIKLPYIGYLFWPLDHFIGALILYSWARMQKQKLLPMQWNFKWSKMQKISVPVIVLPSLVVLVLYFVFHREIADQWPFPKLPLWSMPLVIVLIALLNGLREELYFRFTLQNYLEGQAKKNMAILCSSILFGYMHFRGGYPQGYLGVFLTTLFGLAIGIQYSYSKSITLTWVTHSLTDAVMFAVIMANKS